MERSVRPLLIIAGLAAIVLLLLSPQWTVDDAFISYRYAKNLHLTGELNWNPGDAPVEGYTGIFLPALAWLFFELGASDVVVPMRIAGALACLGTVLVLFLILGKLRVRPFVRSVSLLLATLSPLLYIHSYSGLETIFIVFFISIAIWLAFILYEGSSGPGNYLLLGLVLLLCGLTRPEGGLFAPLVLAYLWFSPARRPILIATGLIFLLGIAAWMIFRLDYYGYFFPNSSAAKRYLGIVNPESIKAAFRFFATYALFPLGAASLLWLIDMDRAAIRESRFPKQMFWRFMLLSMAFGVFVMAVYIRVDLFMNYASRFFLPFLPIIVVLFAGFLEMGLANLEEAKGKYPRRSKALKAVLVIAACVQLMIYGFKFKGELGFVRYYRAIVEDEYIPVADYLRSTLPEDATIITYMDAGAVPYYSGLRTIDFGRLNDLFLARDYVPENDAIDYFFEQDADALVMTSEAPDRYAYVDEAHAIQADPRFRSYKLIKVYSNSVGYDYYQFVYLHLRHAKKSPAG